MTTPRDPLDAGCRDPAEIISDAVWLYVRFPLSLPMVEERLAARGLSVPYETVRQCGLKFGRACANRMRDVVAWIGGVDELTPTPVCVQAMRTEFGRPSSNMRLRTWTATSTSVRWRSSVCERRPSPITRLKRDMPVSALARLV